MEKNNENVHCDGLRPIQPSLSCRWKRCLLICVGLPTLGMVSVPCGAQSLANIRSQARAVSPETDKPREDSREEDRKRGVYREENRQNGLFNAALGGIVNSLLGGSRVDSVWVTGETVEESPSFGEIDYHLYADADPVISFVGYPYASGQEGIAAWEDAPLSAQTYQVQTAFWYGTDLDTIGSWNTRFRFDNNGPLGFELHWAHLTEKRNGLPLDRLNLADLNFTWRLFEKESILLRAGGGMNLLMDRVGTEVDYNLTLSADFFPARPWVLSCELDHGEVGATHQTHLLATLGLNYRHAEAFSGYEFRRVGRTDIGGPLLGVRFWW